MEWVIFFLVMAAVMLLMPQPELPGPSKGDPQLPTVSQSRKVPYAVGLCLIKGPNVLDAGSYSTRSIKKKSGGFGGSKQVVATRYFQTIEMAIAWGVGELRGIRAGDYQAWSGVLATDQTFEISAASLFGDRKQAGEGGMVGPVDFITGTGGTVSSAMESETGRDQPGYPGLARCVFRGPFEWGNAQTYKPVQFEYAYFPDGLSQGNHKIGDQANAAYVIYDLFASNRYGLGHVAACNPASLVTMAATLYAEGLGISRVWYDASAADIEAEILQLVDGIRYRNPVDGTVTYLLVRDDFNVLTIPHVDDSAIIQMKIRGEGLSYVASRLSVEYVDIEAGYKTIKVTTQNTAARSALGRVVPVTISHPGAGTSENAQKISTREGLKRTRPRRSGTLKVNRTGWNYLPGDTIRVSYSPYNITDMLVRIIDHSKGSLAEGTVVIEWLEEIFEYGKTMSKVEDTTQENYQLAPAGISDFFIVDGPWFLAGGMAENTLFMAAKDPSASSGFRFESPLGTARGDGTFGGKLTISTLASVTDTIIVLNGISPIPSGEKVSIDAVKSDFSGQYLIYVLTTDGYEIIGFNEVDYDAINDETTLSGCIRGCLDTYPKSLTALDDVWFASDLNDVGQSYSSGNQSTYHIDITPLGEYASPSVHVHTMENRQSKPAPAGNVKINGAHYLASLTGNITVTWSHRDADTQNVSGIVPFADAGTGAAPANIEYDVYFYNNIGGALLESQLAITGETSTLTSFPSDYPELRVEVITRKISPIAQSYQKFEHVLDYTA